MSNFKEGEGAWHIHPALFTTDKLEQGKRYTIILLGDGEVSVRGYATVGGDEFDEDFRLYIRDGKYVLEMKTSVFSTRYIYGFDIIIRDDERTLLMFPNVGTSRG